MSFIPTELQLLEDARVLLRGGPVPTDRLPYALAVFDLVRRLAAILDDNRERRT